MGESQANSMCVDEELVLRLCRVGLELEERFGHACDIEWAVNKNTIFVLQVAFSRMFVLFYMII